MGKLTDLAKGALSSLASSITGGLTDTLKAVNGMLPELAQAAENDAARAAAAEGIPPEGLGSLKKQIVMLLIESLVGPRVMGLFGSLISIVVDLGVARLKREGVVRKPTPEELAVQAA